MFVWLIRSRAWMCVSNETVIQSLFYPTTQCRELKCSGRLWRENTRMLTPVTYDQCPSIFSEVDQIDHVWWNWFIVSFSCSFLNYCLIASAHLFAMNMSFTQCGVPPSLQSSISHLTNFDSILNNAPICRIITAYSNTQNVNLKMFFGFFFFYIK